MQNRKYLSVSQFIDITDNALKRFGSAVILGEISEIAHYSHLYFKIKDEISALECIMFASNLSSLNFRPQIGQKVLVTGVSSVYKKNGSFKFIVRNMIMAGEGLIMERLRLLKEQLNSQGVFAASKRALPEIIDTVGIITSKEGRVLHDMVRTIRQRSSVINIELYDAMVQGDEAPKTLIEALHRANTEGKCDVLIIGRGGGSFEDLLPFSDESLVREIAKSKIVTISAVGHEPDVSLSDFAADFRAATPTAAAVMVSAMTDDMLLTRLDKITDGMTQGLLRQIDYLMMKNDSISSRLKASNPLQHLNLVESRLNAIVQNLSALMYHSLDNTMQRLNDDIKDLNLALDNRLNQTQQRLDKVLYNLESFNPLSKISVFDSVLDGISSRLNSACDFYLHNTDKRLVYIIDKMQMLNPLQTLKRGYAIAYNDKGQMLKAKETKTGDKIRIRLDDGVIKATVNDTNDKPADATIVD
ncbi:Exodeoxyribonuclease 7 large subunit [Anaerobiospirillum thomasii]|uniref:exodeoxyribonuclease VII large subunit n=1 Tax=Anaerobiospirillum thomasii TaxID=179995 RepID=UPI000DA0CEDA|nr:exodeoxyribonuclease VII large subunit [Anaerobiospirillum thomasii]SPT67900.1 Exodeoxyribonuclease 7 large subunit [Anaerobiospirillum thomasii]